jgi:hypothetical protein
MQFIVTTALGDLIAPTPADALAAGATIQQVRAAVLAAFEGRVREHAALLRAGVAPADPLKMAEYQLKERIALLPASQRDAGQVAALTQEAQARGMTLAELLALIGQRAQALASASLRIAAWEAAQRAAVADLNLPADPADLMAALAAAETALKDSAAALSDTLTGA